VREVDGTVGAGIAGAGNADQRPADDQPVDDRPVDDTSENYGSEARRAKAIVGGPSRVARQVAEFHRAYGLPVCDAPQRELDAAQVALRQSLIEEEVGELRAAAAAGDVIGVADALADIVYVAYGTAHTYGVDLDAVLDEVHASNMTKLGADGAPIRREDGKVLKGPGYRAPDIGAVLGLPAR
jgi:predicted HAD superfamily Cof-like phosphohydrolase